MSKRDDFLWFLTAFKEIRYYVGTLTLCRIGHKPAVELLFNPSSGRAIVYLTCSRCCRNLDVQTLQVLQTPTVVPVVKHAKKSGW